MALIDEMLGETTDDSQAIYLSDGGHFENLGLYEMFRRRCSSILVVDAGADEACSLFDLGNAIRKAEIDFGISVDDARADARATRAAGSKPTSDLTATALGFAYGDIDYGGGHTGRLLYLKPSFLPTIPADVRSYGAEHKAFPHESTLDQWFSESQFESYRTWALSDGRPDQLDRQRRPAGGVRRGAQRGATTTIRGNRRGDRHRPGESQRRKRRGGLSARHRAPDTGIGRSASAARRLPARPPAAPS